MSVRAERLLAVHGARSDIASAHLVIASPAGPSVQMHNRRTLRVTVLLDAQLVHVRHGEEAVLVRLRAAGEGLACGAGCGERISGRHGARTLMAGKS